MNKLWVRLSLAFGVVTVVGLIIAALLTNRQVNTQFRRFVANNQMTDPVLLAALAEYYGRNKSWSGIETGLEALHGPGPGGNNWPVRRRPPNLILADAGGKVVYDHLRRGETRLTRAEKARAVPIEWQDQTVGHLLVRLPGQGDLSRAAQGFLGQVKRSFIQAGLIAEEIKEIQGSSYTPRSLRTLWKTMNDKSSGFDLLTEKYSRPSLMFFST